MESIQLTAEPAVDELLSDPIMHMLLDTGDMTVETFKPMLEETAKRIFKDVA